MLKLWEVCFDYNVPLDFLFYSPEEIEQWRDVRTHVISHALKDGKVLYERHDQARRMALMASKDNFPNHPLSLRERVAEGRVRGLLHRWVGRCKHIQAYFLGSWSFRGKPVNWSAT